MRPAIRRAVTLALLAACACCALAHAAPAKDELSVDDLYLEALQAISEHRRDDAKAALELLIEKVPQHAGAWLDLAITQCELGNGKEAERLFQQIITRFAPPPAILDVIAKRRQQGCDGAAPRNHLAFSIERGIDSNVNQGASNPSFTLGSGSTQIELQLQPEFLPKQDRYSTVTADYVREIPYINALGFAQFRAREYDNLTQFNTVAGALGAERIWHPGKWETRGTAMLGLLTLGGSLYQEQELLQMRATPPLALPPAWQFSVLGGLTHVRYPTLENYDANIWELRSLLSYRTAQWNAQASLGFLADRAIGDRQGGQRQGWYASATARHRLYGGLVGELGWTRQTWQHQTAFSPGLIDRARYQDTQIVRATAILPVKDHQSVQLEVRNVSNRENISLFQYDSRSLQISYHWQNF